MSITVTGDGPNIALTGSGSSFTITVTTGSGAVSTVNGQTGTVVLDSDDVAGPIKVAAKVSTSITALGGTVSSGTVTCAALNSVPTGDLIWLTGDGADNGFYAKSATNTFTETTDYLTSSHLARIIVVGNDISLDQARTVYAIGAPGGVVGAQRVSILTTEIDEVAFGQIRDIAAAFGDELAQDITNVFRCDDTGTGRWSTPNLTTEFTTGISVRTLMIPRRPASLPNFCETLTQAHDSGVGSWDNFEQAVLWPDDSFTLNNGTPATDVLEGKPFLFWEQTESGGSTDGGNWYADVCIEADRPIEVMTDITFSTGVGRQWLRVPYALDDGGTYHTDADDGAIFRRMSTRTSTKFQSIDAHTEAWWLGNNFSGDIARIIVRDGLDGTLIANPDADTQTVGVSSFTDGAGNTWTAGANAEIVALTATGGASALDDLSDVTLGTPATGEVLRYNGTAWVDATPTVDVVSNVATSRILGRTTAGSGDSEELTAAQTRSLLSVAPASRLVATGYYSATGNISSTASGVTSNRLYFVPFHVPRTTTFDRIAVNHAATAAGASSVGRFGIYNNTGDLPGTLLAELGTIDLSTAAAFKPLTISQQLTEGIWWLAFVAQVTSGSPTFTASPPAIMVPNPAGDNLAMGTLFTNSVTGSLPGTAAPASTLATGIPVIYMRAA